MPWGDFGPLSFYSSYCHGLILDQCLFSDAETIGYYDVDVYYVEQTIGTPLTATPNQR